MLSRVVKSIDGLLKISEEHQRHFHPDDPSAEGEPVSHRKSTLMFF